MRKKNIFFTLDRSNNRSYNPLKEEKNYKYHLPCRGKNSERKILRQMTYQ